MKIKPLTVLFIISVALNVVGTVFTGMYLQARSKVNKLKLENSELKVTAVSSGSLRSSGASGSSDLPALETMEAPGSRWRRDFVSKLDGEPDFFLIAPPAGFNSQNSFILFVYLHGMGGDAREPFLIPQPNPLALLLRGQKSNAVLASLSYRKKDSWGNEKAVADINQNIDEMMSAYPVGKIVIAGTSMGGTAALAYAANAPEEIKEKIAGVLSVEGAGDLAELYRQTQSPQVRASIESAMGGKPDEKPENYNKASLLSNLAQFPPSARIALITASRDNVVPRALSENLTAEFKKRQLTYKLMEADCRHEPPPAAYYREAIRFLLSPE